MSDDALAVIRRAWHSGGGVAMVAAVEHVGADVCLQWTGDLLFAAVRSRAPGAVELADGVCAALRQRRWDGDTELADALDGARTNKPSALRELPVDLEELTMLLDAGGDHATGGRLDLQTGQVWPAPVSDDDGWTGSEEELDDEERWLGGRCDSRVW